jgi:hypothetical protein
VDVVAMDLYAALSRMAIRCRAAHEAHAARANELGNLVCTAIRTFR